MCIKFQISYRLNQKTTKIKKTTTTRSFRLSFVTTDKDNKVTRTVITQTWPPFTFYPGLINDLKNNWPANGGNHFSPETRFKWRPIIGRFASPNLVRVKQTLHEPPFWLRVSVPPRGNARLFLEPQWRQFRGCFSDPRIGPRAPSSLCDWSALLQSQVGRRRYNVSARQKIKRLILLHRSALTERAGALLASARV